MIQLNASFGKNELVLSPMELKQNYLYGIKIQDHSGQDLSEDMYRINIQSAQEEIENLLAIKFRKQETTENVSFFRDEFQQFGFVRLSYPIQELVSLDGYLGTIRQISYPFQWLSQKISDDDKNLNRQFYIVPNVGAATTGSLVYNGVIPYIGISSYDQIPNYWTVSYITGFNKIPRDLLNLVGKLAAVNILVIAGNLVLGKPGVSTMSLGIDGLSQSLGSGISGQSGAFGGQIKQYLADIQMTLSRVQYTYKGITISTL